MSNRRGSTRRAAAKPARYLDKHSDDSGEDSDGDFQDSGSEASIPDGDSSNESGASSSGEEFTQLDKSRKSVSVKSVNKKRKVPVLVKPKAVIKMNKLKEQLRNAVDATKDDSNDTNFSVKDLTEQQKLLPDFLNLSESDSDGDDDESPKNIVSSLEFEQFVEKHTEVLKLQESNTKLIDSNKVERLSGSDTDEDMIDCDDLAQSTEYRKAQEKINFQNLQEHNKRIEDAKKSLELYTKRQSTVLEKSFDVKDLLALGESNKSETIITQDNSSDSDDEELEEVKENKNETIAQKGPIEVVVELPGKKKSKSGPPDLEMMLKRRINRVKKEYQVYMHKVHILAWLAHGNFVNKVLNDEILMGSALSLIPSEHCYPKGRINIKYIEQITKWFKECMVVHEDKTKFSLKTKKPHLQVLLLQQMKNKVATSNKNKVLIFITLLRSLGIKCRLVLSFQVLPLRPPSTELCSLSTKKDKDVKSKKSGSNKKNIKLIENIVQLDGADDGISKKSKTISKKLLQLKQKAKKEESTVASADSTTSGLSYWDKITHGIIEDDDSKRRSHRDLRSKSNQNSNEKNVIPKSKKEVKNDNATRSSRSSKSKNNVPETKANGTAIKKEIDLSKLKNNKIKKDQIETKKVNLSKLKTRNSTKIDDKDEKLHKVSNKTISKKKPNKKSSEFFENLEQKPSTSTSKKVIVKAEASTSSMPITQRRQRNVKSKISQKMDIDSDTDEEDKKPNRKRKQSEASDLDFKVSKKSVFKKKGVIDRRVLSTDDEESSSDKKKKGVDVWCEIYVEEEEQWISVDVIKGEVHCVNQIYARATHPVTYVVIWDNSGYIKDVTQRYVTNWNTTTRKMRVDPDWYRAGLRPWIAPSHLRDKAEDEQLYRMQLDAPLPKTVSEYKNHPLYALERHLLKFEVIYPPDSITLGFIKNEPVYARECVHTCRSRETWVKEAKVVRPGEQPYKIVKARPKYDRLSGKMITDIPLEIFGPWQVDDYVPPRAENGLVPRNPYGNVELFKPCMLPGGTVHLVLPGLNRVAKKLNIDCAPAMVGFDYHSGGSHPVYDGYVICEEFKDQLVKAWEKDQIESEIRAREKIEKRVYGNWKRLIRGLLIRKRLQLRYDFHAEFSDATAGGSSNIEVQTSQKTKKK